MSLRLSPDIKYCYTSNIFSPPPEFDPNLVWNWQKQPKNSDWGYPMSLDGHIFRTSEIYDRIIFNRSFNNPNTLETQLASRPMSSPLMICYSESKIVNIPANKVQNIYSNRHAQMCDLDDLNQQFLNNYRLSLKPILDTKNISVHQEIPLHLFNLSQDNPIISVVILYQSDVFRLIYQIESLLCQTIMPIEIVCIFDKESLEIVEITELIQSSYPSIKIIVDSSYSKNIETLDQIINRSNKIVVLDVNKFISSTFIEDYISNQNIEDINFYALQYSKFEKERLALRLEQVESQLKFQLELTNPQLRSQLQQTESQLQQTESQLQQSKSQLQQAKINLDAIQSSKFWKFREKWFEVRKKIGIVDEDQELSLRTLYRTFANYINTQKDILVAIDQELWSINIPLVSVVIPCFNYGQYIEEAIDSVLAQTFPNLEIIVVDDGSNDADTINILNNLNKPKTKIIRTNNFKLPSARNNGIKEATGKYICCLDADDLLKPTFIEKCLFKLETENTDICYTWVQEFGDSNAISPTKEFNIETLIYQNCLHVSAIFKRSMWESVGGYDETMVNGYEDWNFWIAIAKSGGRGSKVDEPLFLYRKHGNSMISTALEKHDVLYKQIKINHQELYANKKVIKEIKRNRQKYIVSNSFVNLYSAFQDSPIVNVEKNHILFALPWITTGGVDTVILQLLKTLKNIGFNITVCTTANATLDMGDNTPKYEEYTQEIYNLSQLLEPEHWKNLVFYLIESRNIDVVFLAGSGYFYDILQDIKQQFPSIKIVDQLYNEFGHINNNRRYSSYIDVNIVENESVANCLLLKHQEQSSKVCLIHNGVDTSFFKPSLINDIELSNDVIPKDKFIVSFIGRFSQEKDPELFVEIANHFKNNDSLYFIMAVNGSLYLKTLERIKKYGLANKIYLPGFVDTREYLNISNLLVLPSRIDGRPNAVLESLSMGVPVIASSVGGVPKIIKDRYNGFLCESGNVNSFVNRIQEVVTNKDLYLNMRKNARNYAIENLDLSNAQSKYISLFEELLSQNFNR